MHSDLLSCSFNLWVAYVLSQFLHLCIHEEKTNGREACGIWDIRRGKLLPVLTYKVLIHTVLDPHIYLLHMLLGYYVPCPWGCVDAFIFILFWYTYMCLDARFVVDSCLWLTFACRLQSACCWASLHCFCAYTSNKVSIICFQFWGKISNSVSIKINKWLEQNALNLHFGVDIFR